MLPEAQSKFRPRRRHRKSRNGCLECKRRRIKCDEMKPSCSRCVLTMQKCIYPPTSPTSQPQGEAPEARDDRALSLPTPSPRFISSSPSPSQEQRLSPLPHVEPSQHFSYDTSDTGLYHHYLQHTSRTLTDNPRDLHALQICLPTLALRSKTVFHSILAVSAACMCYDMINLEFPPDVGTVSYVLMTGYRHYNLASERLRELISRPSASNAEPLLAAPPLLVPFVTCSQQISHWVSSRTDGHSSPKLLSTTPRDVIIISQVIRATIRELEADTSPITTPQSINTEEIDSMDEIPTPPSKPPPSHSHPMFQVISSTSQRAFSKLQDRINSAIFYSSTPNPSLSACSEAFTVLETLRSAVFPSPGSTAPALPPSMTTIPTLPQVPRWLHAFTARPSTPSPTEHMTRPFLSFFIETPQAYLDLVLPLLDKRLQGPSPQQSPAVDPPTDPSLDPSLVLGLGSELSIEQALALDIYAHWSVLMFLVSEESWWIGNLPDITLNGMVNRYGDDFVRKWFPSGSAGGRGEEEWWPGGMMSVAREIGRFR
ncbi:hypothetical protein ASPVEDRAFT_201474 [Aspergillus versicolor CBS 583.65]|uniref:Zn(2)-C6 fungal-type domain-containing protein n=1 Tax=Aspergillus versicolor CBS 583.65 TaxID=1036611 RepID=A0A1L9PZS1_ASPVE|nr:uncharacterized protein ASPVEDRAFT_201474 [Aspergillus versicolor CBS 583.65]OJJ07007.1 hypothetical protein ASPVEDRAFT_201474 [Aspergillus versicolor CBS 583.65]